MDERTTITGYATIAVDHYTAPELARIYLLLNEIETEDPNKAATLNEIWEAGIRNCGRVEWALTLGTQYSKSLK